MCASRLCVQKAPAHFIKGENLLKLTYPNVIHWLTGSLYVLIYDCPILIFTVLSVCIHNFSRGFAVFARLGPQSTITFILCEKLRELAGLNAI